MNYEFGFFEAGDDGVSYRGIYNPSVKWNEWKCPLFDYDTAKSIIDTQMSLEDCINHSCSRYDFSDYPKGIIDRYEDGIEFYPVVIFEGIEYYSIGAMCWTWFKINQSLIIKDIIDSKIDEMFVESCNKLSIKNGDISPEQYKNIEIIKNDIFKLLQSFIIQNNCRLTDEA